MDILLSLFLISCNIFQSVYFFENSGLLQKIPLLV